MAILALTPVLAGAGAGATTSEALHQTVQSVEVSFSAEPMTWEIEKHWLRGNVKRPFASLTSLDKGGLLATYVDDKGELQVWQFTNDRAKRLTCEVPNSRGNWQWINRLHFAHDHPVLLRARPVFEQGREPWRPRSVALEVIGIDLVSANLTPLKSYQLRFPPEWARRGLEIEDALPWADGVDRYFVVGRYVEVYPFTKWGFPAPDPESFEKTCTGFLLGTTNSGLVSVEMPGRHWVHRIAFTAGSCRHIEAAWVRRWTRGKYIHNALYYSAFRSSGEWSVPRLVCPGAGSDWCEFTDVSIARIQDVTCILWSWDEKGIYVAELRGDQKPWVLKLADWDGYDSQMAEGVGLLADAPNLDLYTDPRGTAYAIWALNKRLERLYPDGATRHRIQTACRINGQWQAPITVSEGAGIVRSPTIVVDKHGYAHITYLRSEGDTFRCLYRRLPAFQHPAR
ncbi:MAG: hypothetical protein GX456_07425 [Verrucomicrobia bacterium]|nr:hypothetical protein [Verrucomicrobiota bacterium]